MGREELPGLVSHTPALPPLRPRGLLTLPAPTNSSAVCHYPDGGHMRRKRRMVAFKILARSTKNDISITVNIP